ncbi:hypothetical protein ABE28_013040 [Peribacillus muralis]|uniref:Uncharacterized protein n=1 Tax=Peribacillus muralis TaxID=264697 RepID=A0A1B3XPZ3_9BACI|nr:hypothetical protein ABE28_013040 [Peribacillus muralis]
MNNYVSNEKWFHFLFILFEKRERREPIFDKSLMTKYLDMFNQLVHKDNIMDRPKSSGME